ncbi:CDP-glucose 4,6-dehydratase [Rhodobacterales bacterium FZCC0069]|nr:CDP-glucose 4,6-dehydratase [Rhodobacterales bacterium FZCC0069]
MNPSFWKNKTVFLTGHTGFKGGWMAHWLYELGASVHGFSCAPPTQPNFFTETRLQTRLARSVIGDIRDFTALMGALKTSKPDIVIHMAAQSLVRESYKTPVDTFSANVMGTVNLLEAARQVGTAKAIINITTDKCYENKEWIWPYRENDHLGGRDPYSSSKACADIAAAAYRSSFLADANIHLASVRAGNVIGGGDWATDRLLPDFLRALESQKTLSIRSPNAVRPWQHVLEPLSGYLMLAQKLYEEGAAFAEAWNFGPNDEGAKSVGWIVEQLCAQIPAARWEIHNVKQAHEANMLKLDSSKARARLGWVPRWSLETALSKTIEWHQAWSNREDLAGVTSEQIQVYVNQ